MSKTKLVDLELKLNERLTSEKAYAVEDGTEITTGTGAKRMKIYWLPKSQVEIHREGSKTIFTIPEWLAIDKGLV